jgi:hypothetical protein
MFGWFKKKKKIDHSEEINQVIELLFPDYKEEMMPDGSLVVVDRSVDNNLDAVLVDLQDGINDKTIQNTINECIKKLYQARKILQVDPDLPKNARGVIVDITAADFDDGEIP